MFNRAGIKKNILQLCLCAWRLHFLSLFRKPSHLYFWKVLFNIFKNVIIR